jgi:hypothetical protein
VAVQKQDGLHTDQGESGSDLTGKEFYFCKRGTDGLIALAGNGESIAGVISQGRTTGKHTSYNTRGNPILKVVAGGTITVGQEVQSNADGEAIAGTTNPFGYARSAAVEGQYVEISTEPTT